MDKVMHEVKGKSLETMELFACCHLLQAIDQKTLCSLYHRPRRSGLQSWRRQRNPRPGTHNLQGIRWLELHGEEAKDRGRSELAQQLAP